MEKLKLNSVFKSFGSTEVIHGVDLSVKDYEFAVFVGPSGCGKSTLLRLIAGLEDVNQGEISIEGERVDHLPPADQGLLQRQDWPMGHSEATQVGPSASRLHAVEWWV